MEQTIEENLKEIKNYLKPITQEYYFPFEGFGNHATLGANIGRLQVMGEFGKILISKMKLLSKILENPKDLKEKIIQFEEICDSCANAGNATSFPDSVQINLLISIKKEAKETIDLFEKVIKKFEKNKKQEQKDREFERMKKEIEDSKKELTELKSKVLSYSNQNKNDSEKQQVSFFSSNNQSKITVIREKNNLASNTKQLNP